MRKSAHVASVSHHSHARKHGGLDFPSSVRRPQELKHTGARLRLNFSSAWRLYSCTTVHSSELSQICWAKTAGLNSLVFHHKNTLMKAHEALLLLMHTQEMQS